MDKQTFSKPGTCKKEQTCTACRGFIAKGCPLHQEYLAWKADDNVGLMVFGNTPEPSAAVKTLRDYDEVRRAHGLEPNLREDAEREMEQKDTDTTDNPPFEVEVPVTIMRINGETSTKIYITAPTGEEAGMLIKFIGRPAMLAMRELTPGEAMQLATDEISPARTHGPRPA